MILDWIYLIFSKICFKINGIKANMEKKKINLGKIIGPHGIRGLFKVEFYNQDYLDLKI